MKSVKLLMRNGKVMSDRCPDGNHTAGSEISNLLKYLLLHRVLQHEVIA